MHVRYFALGIALTLGVPTVARASQNAPADADAARERAASLYKQGRSKFELFDFAGAIELWAEAYSLVPEGDPDAHAIRSALVHNLSIAHVNAFDVDEDITHLRTAKMLLERYIKEAEAIDDGSEDSRADLETARTKLTEVQGKLTVAEAAIAAAEPEPEPEPEPKDPGPKNPGPKDPGTTDPGVPAPTDPVAVGGPEDTVEKPGKGLVVGGGALIGVGAAFGGVGLAGAFMGQGAERKAVNDPADLRPDHLRSGRTANTLGYIGAIGGGVFLITGVAVLAAGAARNKKAKTARLNITPLVGPLSGVHVEF